MKKSASFTKSRIKDLIENEDKEFHVWLTNTNKVMLFVLLNKKDMAGVGALFSFGEAKKIKRVKERIEGILN